MLKMLIEKLESYAFECEGGPLINCKDWQRLKKLVSEQNAATVSGGQAVAKTDSQESPAVEHCRVAAPDLVERLTQAREKLLHKWTFDGDDLEAIEEAITALGECDASVYCVAGWLRGHEFIGLPEQVREGDKPVYVKSERLEAAAALAASAEREKALTAVIAELVRLKSLHDRIERGDFSDLTEAEVKAKRMEYSVGKVAAWQAAVDALRGRS